jgi:methyltransferase (TIGR00027 family)
MRSGSFQMWHQIAARTRFFDDQVLHAISAGISQVVICGAGYDDRALRFRSPGVRFFELDHPATQAAKQRQLQAMGADTAGLTQAPADFNMNDVATVLQNCGHDVTSPSLFICEGLLVYLEQSTCVRLLAGLRSRSDNTSRLAASLATHPAGVSSRDITARANAQRRTGQKEPWRTILPLDTHLALLRAADWHVQRDLDAADVDLDAAPGRTHLISAAPGVPDAATSSAEVDPEWG